MTRDVEIACEVRVETDKALLIFDGTKEVWIPKSQIRDRKDPRKKIGNNQVVPLLGRCYDIISRQQREKHQELIFPVNGSTWSSIFPRACHALHITDLTLYDLRHEAISRLVENGKHSIPEMMLVTGHKDPKQLMRYTQLRAVNLHR